MQRRIVVVDGVDMCGKTEIAKALSSSLSGVFHCPYFKNEMERKVFGTSTAAEYFTNTLRYGMSYMTSYFEQSNAGAVFDRCYPSEWVYTRLFDRPTDAAALERCDDRFSKMGAKIILTYRTSYDGISDDTHPELLGPNKLRALDTLYRQFAEWTHCEVLMLNVDDENLERELHECLPFITQETK